MLSQTSPSTPVRPASPTVAEAPLVCRVSPDRDVVTIAVHGELDIATVPVLDGHLREVRDAGFEQLVADLRGLTFIDSSGVQLMLRWSASAAELGHGFRILPGPRARAVFAITGTLDALGIEPVGDGRAAP